MIGRFAPSPTGPLHLGSLATALGSFLDARLHGGQWLLRIEDIDEGRCKPEFTEAILQTLQAHGLAWDGVPWVQSQRHGIYQEALNHLHSLGHTYPCGCTRQDIELANQNRSPGEQRVYPGTCRQGIPEGRQARAVRLRCPSEPVCWLDHRLGPQRDLLSGSSGDFVLKRGDGYWAYHLVVVVDDLLANVSSIVRGEDLTDTTGRQIALWRLLQPWAAGLGHSEGGIPTYWHLPVICSPDGQKLSKQTGAQALDLTMPYGNLNTVWQHFGLPPITGATANTPAQWLKAALPYWANYRAAQRYA